MKPGAAGADLCAVGVAEISDFARTGEFVRETGQIPIHSSRWRSSTRRVLVAIAILLPLLLVGTSLRGRASYALSAFGDLSQLFLLATTTLFFAWKGVFTRGTLRAFWLLIALGFALWSANMSLWVYYEVLRNRQVPSIPIGEFLLFIKFVPMLAALALGPGGDTLDRPRVLGFLDFTSLLVCWTYVYLFCAMAYLIAGHDLANYNSNSDIVDTVGNQVFLFVLAVAARRSRHQYRGFYLRFLGAAAIYDLASFLMDHALSKGNYYTGSYYDVPLTAALAWFCITAITYPAIPRSDPATGALADSAQLLREKKNGGHPDQRTVFWARLSMLATLATPVIGLWLVKAGETSEPVRYFRILLTLFTMLILAVLLFLKQDLLNLKLAGYLQDASLTYTRLKRFEGQLVQSEKLASLGKLVSRVAYEINGAMAAVRKDVDALEAGAVADATRQRMTSKIGDSARRTNALVENMLSFAQEMPLQRSSVNIRPLLESAINLTRAGRTHKARVEIQEDGAVPMVEGDANQLMQVFLHIIANAIDAMEGSEAGLLTISIRAEQKRLEIGFADTGSGLRDPRRVFEPFYTTKPVGKGMGLGLSTCYGIVRQHGGEIDCHNRPEGGAVFRLALPAAVATAAAVEIAS
jgi:signal transduction histidine kinase